MVQTVVERNIQAVVEGVACYRELMDQSESHLHAWAECSSPPLKNNRCSDWTASFAFAPALNPGLDHEELDAPPIALGKCASIWSSAAWGGAAVTAVLGGELFVWEAGDNVMLIDSDEQEGGSAPGCAAKGGGARGGGLAARGRAEFGRGFRFDLADVTAPLLAIGK